jgi:hypothetical protein
LTEACAEIWDKPERVAFRSGEPEGREEANRMREERSCAVRVRDVMGRSSGLESSKLEQGSQRLFVEVIELNLLVERVLASGIVCCEDPVVRAFSEGKSILESHEVM